LVTTREVFLKPGKITVEERELPPIKPHQVLVKTHQASVCGSERYHYRGIVVSPEYKARGRYIPKQFKVAAPSVQKDGTTRSALGHEGGGTIVEVGSAVREYLYHPGRKIKVGDKVSLYTPTYSDYAIVDGIGVGGAWSIQPIPEGVTFDVGCLFEPFGCAGWAALHLGVMPGDIVSINGCGFSGLVLMQGAIKHGASAIIAVDIVEKKLDIARQLVSTSKAKFYAINPRKEDYVQRVNDITDGEGVDVATENVGGTAIGIKQAVDQVRHNGIVALYGDNYVPFPNFHFHRFHEDGLDIRPLNAVHYNELQNVMNLNEAYRAAERGVFDEFWPLLWENSANYKLDQIADVFEDEAQNIEAQTSIKTRFTP
jgi:threonine dehydrogenase-like Zn-dependent dehydrogenase